MMRAGGKVTVEMPVAQPPAQGLGGYVIYISASWQGKKISDALNISRVWQLRFLPYFPDQGSPWENGYNESFNGKLRDEFLNGEIFYRLKEAQVLIEGWRREYNTTRSHSSLGYRPPASEAMQPNSCMPFMPPLTSAPLMEENNRPLN